MDKYKNVSQSQLFVMDYFRVILICFIFTTSMFANDQVSQVTLKHHKEYVESLNKIKNAKWRLVYEMNRIQIGEVSHYDFLQYEHIELVRHVKALVHVPFVMSKENSKIVIKDAQNLLDLSNQLEWVLSDFLHAHALVSSSRSNIEDLARQINQEESVSLLPLHILNNKDLSHLVSKKDENQHFILALNKNVEQFTHQLTLEQKAFQTLLESPLEEKIFEFSNQYKGLTQYLSQKKGF